MISPDQEAAAGGKPRILFIGKRFYTNKDAFEERYGRIYQLPLHWAASTETRLWLIDYHRRRPHNRVDGPLSVVSTPALSFSSLVTLLHLCLRWRPQRVVASGDCYIGVLGWVVSVLCGARFAFDIYDKYDEFAAYRRPLGVDLFAFLRRRAGTRFYASSALLRSLGYAPSARDVVVPNGVDEALFTPSDLQVCRARLRIAAGSGHIVGYFGSMEPVRGVQDLVEAVALLRKDGTDVKLLICGKPDPSVDLVQDWILYHGLVPHAEVPHYIGACDVVVLPYRRSPILDSAASCKIVEYLKCDRPLVSTRTPNFLNNFSDQAAALGAGLCAPQDSVGLAHAIAWQLRERRTVPAPQDVGWRAISSRALQALADA